MNHAVPLRFAACVQLPAPHGGSVNDLIQEIKAIQEELGKLADGRGTTLLKRRSNVRWYFPKILFRC